MYQYRDHDSFSDNKDDAPTPPPTLPTPQIASTRVANSLNAMSPTTLIPYYQEYLENTYSDREGAWNDD